MGCGGIEVDERKMMAIRERSGEGKMNKTNNSCRPQALPLMRAVE